MAVQRYRFRKTGASIDLAQLRALTDPTADIDASAGGQVIDVEIEETLLDDLVEVMASKGYEQVGGVNPAGTPGDATEFVRRTGDTMTGNLALTSGARVTGVPDIPGAATDAVNANYVDAAINGRDPKESSRASTTASLIAASWTPAGSGVGKTLTSPTDSVAFNDFDGVTLVAGDRLLVWSEAGANRVHNGIYVLTTEADGAGQEAVLTRASDFDQDAEVTQGAYTFIVEGTVNERLGFILITPDPIIIDTTELEFTQVFGAGGGGSTDTLIFGANSVLATTVSRFLYPGYSDDQAQTTTIQIVAPRAGILRNLRVRHNDPAGNGNAIVYTVRVNGTPTSLSASLASTSANGSDTSNTASVVAGDLIDLIVTKAAGVGTSPTDVTAMLEFDA